MQNSLLAIKRSPYCEVKCMSSKQPEKKPGNPPEKKETAPPPKPAPTAAPPPKPEEKKPAEKEKKIHGPRNPFKGNPFKKK